MKKSHLALVAVVLAGGMAALFWWTTAPGPSGDLPKPAPSAPVPLRAPPPLLPPILPPPPNTPLAPIPTASATAPTASNPQAEPGTAASDLARLLRGGDLLTALHTYYPPDQWEKMTPDQRSQLEDSLQNPDIQQVAQNVLQALDAVGNFPPTMNAAGDHATYQAPYPNSPVITMRKVNGLWYLDRMQ